MTETLKIPGADAAILGLIERADGQPIVVYDRELLIELFVNRDGMTREDAAEYVLFNIEGAWVGPGTPAILDFMTPSEIEEYLADDPS